MLLEALASFRALELFGRFDYGAELQGTKPARWFSHEARRERGKGGVLRASHLRLFSFFLFSRGVRGMGVNYMLGRRGGGVAGLVFGVSGGWL